MKFKLSEIRRNPFHHPEAYPVKLDEGTAVVAAIEQIGFWDDVIGRFGPDGKPEIAYGHHRVDLARKALGPDALIDLIVKDLDDESMIKMMANDNRNEWGTSAVVEQQTVRAVVEAYADDKIKLKAPAKKTNWRYAPNYLVGSVPPGGKHHPYTALEVAHFLEWTRKDGTEAQPKVVHTLAALALIEEELLRAQDFSELGTAQAEAVIQQTCKRRTAAEYESPAEADRAAARVGFGVAERLRSGYSSIKDESYAAVADVTLY